MKLQHTVAEVAALVGGRVGGREDRRLEALRSLAAAGPRDLAAVFGAGGPARTREAVDGSRAGCLLVAEGVEAETGEGRSLVWVDDPEAALDAVAAAWGPDDGAAPGVHPTAVVAPAARVDPTASLGPHVVLDDGASVGARTRLGPGVHLGRDASVGDDCRLAAHVVIGPRCRLGHRVVVHAGSVLGADGFGFRRAPDGRHLKSPQVGTVRVGDDVEIGALCTVDRARLEETVLEDGVKLDDHVHVGHNTRVGAHTAIAGGALLAGSAVIGRRCRLAGLSSVVGGVTVGDDGVVGAYTLVLKDTAPGSFVVGLPARPHREWKRLVATLDRLVRRRSRAAAAGPGDGR